MGTVCKCLIVDDEKQAHLVIKSHISNCEELEFSASAFNGKEAIQLLSKLKFDLVFLDIDMPLINGIEVMQTISHRPATIITTAYNNFAFEAYQNDAVDYLLKPISFPRFLKAIEKAKHFYNPDNENYSKRLAVRFEGITKELETDDICYMQSIGNYVKIFLNKPEKPITVYNSLKNLLDSTSSKQFLQTHKSFIINTNYLEKVEKEFVLLKGNISIPIGRKYEILLSNFK
jgi:DNA-binding LytR/AlgR family response regulator